MHLRDGVEHLKTSAVEVLVAFGANSSICTTSYNHAIRIVEAIRAAHFNLLIIGRARCFQAHKKFFQTWILIPTLKSAKRLTVAFVWFPLVSPFLTSLG